MSRQTKHFYEFGGFRLEPDERLLKRAGEVVPLKPKAFDLLLVFVAESGHLLGKEELLQRVWPDSIVEEANLSHNIYKLREALGEGRNGAKYIETVPRRGYRFVAQVTEVCQDEMSVLAAEATHAHILIEESLPAVFANDAQLEIQQPSQKVTTARAAQVTRGAARRWPVWVLACLLVSACAAGGYLFIRARGPRAGAQPLKSIAVLPFRPVAAGARDETLELGMADTLITRLSNLPQLTVRPVSAVRKYTDLQQDALAAGQELGVDSVLDGSVQRAGDELRVTVRLIKVADGTTLWAEKFDSQFTNIFAVQDAISERVAEALAQELSGQQRERLVRRETADTNAYELYLRGRYFLNKTNAENLHKAVNYFQQAIAQDPQYARAYAGQADAYNALGLWNYLAPGEAFPRAKEAAQKALALDDTSAEAHADLAYILFRYDWDYPAADAEYRRAVELNANDIIPHYLYGEYLTTMRRYDEAAREQQRALELDPLFLPNRMMIAARLYFMRRYDDAVAQLQQITELDQNFVVAYDLLWAAYRERGLYDQSVAARLQSLRLQGYTEAEAAALKQAYAAAGVQGFWRKDNELISAHLQQHTSPLIFIAMNYAQLGDKDQAFAWLERAYAERQSWLPELQADPVWDKLRDEPRFADLLRRMKLD